MKSLSGVQSLTLQNPVFQTTGAVSSTGDVSVSTDNITTSGAVTSTGAVSVTAGDIVSSGGVTATGAITTGAVSVTTDSITSSGTLTASGAISSSGDITSTGAVSVGSVVTNVNLGLNLTATSVTVGNTTLSQGSLVNTGSDGLNFGSSVVSSSGGFAGSVSIADSSSTSSDHNVLLALDPTSGIGQKDILRDSGVTYNPSTGLLSCGTTGNAATATKALGLDLSTAGYVKCDADGAMSVDSTALGSLLTSEQAGHISTNTGKVGVSADSISSAGAVLKTGDETIAGTKTFSSDIVGRIDEATKALGLNLTTAGYVKCDANGAMSVDSTSQGSLLMPDQAGKIQTNHSKVGVSASSISSAGAVLKTGDETIAGVKTFSSKIVGNIDTAVASTTVYVADTTSNSADHSVLLALNPSSNDNQKNILRDTGITFNTATNKLNCGTTGTADTALAITTVTTMGFVRNKIVGDGGNPETFSMELQVDNRGELITSLQTDHITANNDKPTTSAVTGLISTAVGTLSTAIGNVSSTLSTAINTLSSTVNTNATKYVHVYNSGFQTNSSNKNFWIPFRGTGEVANSYAGNPMFKMEQCTFIAPHDGIVKKILFRTETSMSSGYLIEASFKLCKAASGIEIPSLSNQVGSTYSKTSSITDDITYTRNDLSEDYNWILQENVLYGLNISMLAAPIDMVFCMVVEYTI